MALAGKGTKNASANKWVLADLTSDGESDWDLWYHPVKDGDHSPGKRESAIRDTARCRFVIRMGKDALPTVMTMWQEYEKRKPLSRADQLRQYALARIINILEYNAGIRRPVWLPSKPPDNEQVWREKIRQHGEAIREAQSREKKGPAEK